MAGGDPAGFVMKAPFPMREGKALMTYGQSGYESFSWRLIIDDIFEIEGPGISVVQTSPKPKGFHEWNANLVATKTCRLGTG